MSKLSDRTKEARLRRREEKALRKEEKQQNKDFKKTVKNSKIDRAPYTEKTRGYYRFSRKYPNEVDAEGFRKNKKQKPYGTTLKVILCIVLCIFAFSLGTFVTKTAIELARIEPETEETVTVEETAVKAQKFDKTAWESSKDATIAALKQNNINTVVIEIKKPDGTMPYSLTGNSLADIIKEITEAGFKTAAWVSCLKDTAHINNFPGHGVLTTEEGNPVLYDKSGYAYINPFNDEAVTYLTETVKSVSAAGFDYIILDDVTLPTNTGSSVPYYTGYSGKTDDLNKALTVVVSKIINEVGADKIILVTDIYGFCSSDSVTGSRYEGTLNPPTCIMRAVDLRTDNQNTTGKDTLNLMPYLQTVPDAFVLEAASVAMKNVKNGVKLFAVCANSEDAELAQSSGVENIIIYG